MRAFCGIGLSCQLCLRQGRERFLPVGLFVAIGLFSAFVNLLLLTGPLFMLQIYDRVLTSRLEATLMALTAIAGFLFLMMGLLDHARSRVLARAGARVKDRQSDRDGGAVQAVPGSATVPIAWRGEKDRMVKGRCCGFLEGRGWGRMKKGLAI